MAVFKRLLILSFAIFLASVNAQLRGSNTETAAENAVASPDEVSSDTAAMVGAEPLAVDLDAASAENLPSAVDGEPVDSLDVDSLEVEAAEPEIDILNANPVDIAGLEDAALDSEVAAPVSLEDSGISVAEPAVSIESGIDAGELIGLADAAAGDDVAFVDLGVDPEVGLTEASLVMDTDADSLAITDPSVGNTGSQNAGIENGIDAEEVVGWADSAANEVGTAFVDGAVEPEAIVLDAGLINEENADLIGMADSVVIDENPTAAIENPTATIESAAAAIEDPTAAMEIPIAAAENPTAVMENPTVAMEIPTSADVVGFADAVTPDELATAVGADSELVEASLSVPEDLALPTDVAELEVAEATRETLTDAANADFAAAMEELARDNNAEGLAFIDNEASEVQEDFGPTAEIVTPVLSREPSAIETTPTLEGFDAAGNSATRDVPESIEIVDLPGIEAALATEELAVEAPGFVDETTLPVASADAADIPEVTGEIFELSNGDMTGFETGLTGVADPAEIVDVAEETNQLAEAIDAELASLASAVEDRFDTAAAAVTDAEMEAVAVGDEVFSTADEAVNELGGVIDSVTAPSGFQSFIDETRDALPVDVAPVMEAVMSGSEAISTPLAEVTVPSLETIVAEEAAAEVSEAPDVAMDASTNVEDDAEVVLVNYSEDHEKHDHEGHDHESHMDADEEMEAMESHASAGMHTYPSMLTLLVVAFTTVGVFF